MATELTKGARFNLSQNYSDLQQIEIELGWTLTAAGYEIDSSAFLLGSDRLIPEEGYFVFYNNPKSPEGAVEKVAGSGSDRERFFIDFSQLNPLIEEIIFVVTIHEGVEKNQNFSQVSEAFIAVSDRQNHQPLVRYQLTERFASETALEFGRLYHKDGQWRFHALGQGYNAGLQGFVDQYHHQRVDLSPVTPPPPPVPSQKQKAIELQKKLEREAPGLFDLVKKADIALQKANLTGHQGQVCLCLDVSASMYSLYNSGKIQQLAERILALGCRFDDDGAIKIFLFAGNSQEMGEMTIDNFHNFIGQARNRYNGEGGTMYSPAMRGIRNAYFPDCHGGERLSPVKRSTPVYVMFVTDGQPFDQAESEQQLRWSSYEPIFWQFMAIGKSNKDGQNKRKGWFGLGGGNSEFEFLESLDNLGGKYVDNADFFSVEDPGAIADQDLYDLLMTEYPNWVKNARNHGLLS